MRWKPLSRWGDMAFCPRLSLLAVREWDEEDDSVGWTVLYECPRGTNGDWKFRQVRCLDHEGYPRAFTDPLDGQPPDLLVEYMPTWKGVKAVDIFSGEVRVDVCDPGLNIGTSCVAARAGRVAIGEQHVGLAASNVWMFKSDGPMFQLLWRISVGTSPDDTLALSFTRDGAGLEVSAYGGISVYGVRDPNETIPGTIPETIPGAVQCRSWARPPSECWPVDDGTNVWWMVISHDREEGDGERITSLQGLPGLGVLVTLKRENEVWLQLRTHPDRIAQAAMSWLRVEWMAAVARGVLDRARRQKAAAGGGDRGKRQRRRGK